jgi:Na+/melibiose symporter-like transporter
MSSQGRAAFFVRFPLHTAFYHCWPVCSNHVYRRKHQHYCGRRRHRWRPVRFRHLFYECYHRYSSLLRLCRIILLTVTGTQAYKCYFNQGTVNADRECQGPTTGAQGGITAAMTAGSWAGALVSGYLSDILGRRKAIMIGCVIWVIGSAVICASQNIPMLVVGRIINGFCVGIQSAQVPVYISAVVWSACSNGQSLG